MNTSIHSQNTLYSSKDSLTVSYFRMGELAKFVEYKKHADSLLVLKGNELNELENAYSVSEYRNKTFKELTVPKLEQTIEYQEEFGKNREEVFKIREAMYEAKIRSKRGNFFKGTLIGAGLTALAILIFGG